MLFESINSLAVHYRYRKASRGAKTLVLINSLGTDFRIWDQFIEFLPSHIGVLCYDKRGHGLSDIGEEKYDIGQLGDDLIGLMDALELSDAVVCGLSVGGMIALDVYTKRPELFSGLVIMDSAPKIGDAGLWQARIDRVRETGMVSIASATMERWFSQSFRDEQPAALSAFHNMLVRTNATGYIRTCEAIRDGDYTHMAPTIAVPTLCLVGSEDGASTPQVVRQAAEIIPNAEYHEIAGAGHLPCVEAPEASAALITRFISAISIVGEAASNVDRYEQGMSTRREVLGNPHVDRASRNSTPFDEPFQQLITEAAWGHVWSRQQWTLRERSIVTIALLAALGHEEEVAMHVRATANTGATLEDLCETMLHVAIYAGVPAANSAIKVVKKTVAENGEREGKA